MESGCWARRRCAASRATAVESNALCEAFTWHEGLSLRLSKGWGFYGVIAGATLIGLGLNFIGIDPIKALVFAGIVQGFSTPFLMLMIMLITNNRAIMGKWVNGRAINILGWITTAAIFAAAIGLVVVWIR